MCTAVIFGEKNRYFGRNLDHYTVYDEQVIITPRNYKLPYRNGDEDFQHFAMIGMGTVMDGYPLYYEATNEYGLSVAGLNFVGNAVYDVADKGAYIHRAVSINGKNEVTRLGAPPFEVERVSPCRSPYQIEQFELVPYILGRCRTTDEAEEHLLTLNMTAHGFSPDLPPPQLHWMIADSERCITLEIMRDGMHIYDNAVGVLTNNPPFDFHAQNLSSYINLTSDAPINRFGDDALISRYSHGMGAIGLPGDASSASRFVRAAFVRANANHFDGRCDGAIRWKRHADEYNGVTENMLGVEQFFHILGSVEQIDGCVRVGEHMERTQYSSCCDTLTGKYYFRTYFDSRICSVALFDADLDGVELALRRVSDMKH